MAGRGLVSRSGSAAPSSHGRKNSYMSCNRCHKSLSTTCFVCACDCVFCEGTEGNGRKEGRNVLPLYVSEEFTERRVAVANTVLYHLTDASITSKSFQNARTNTSTRAPAVPLARKSLERRISWNS
jgi:hypothetical protein